MSEIRKTAEVTLDQFFCIASFERVMSSAATEAGMLRAIGKNEVAEKFESILRHVAKGRDEYATACKSSLIIAQAGAIPNINGMAP